MGIIHAYILMVS